MRRRVRLTLSILAVSALVALTLALSACRWLRSDRPLVVAFDDIPPTLDPHYQNHLITWSVLGNIYDSLVRFSTEMRLEPALATEWGELDATHWRLTLRSGVKFQNGDPFTADDVVASFNRARTSPRSLIRHNLLGLRRMSAVNAGVLEIETDGPVPDLLNRLAYMFIVPRSAAAVAEITHPVGTGPYAFVSRHQDGSILLEAFSGWQGRPPIERVLMTFYENNQISTQHFLAGGVDVTHSLPDDEVAEVERHPGLRVEAQPRLTVQLLAVSPRAATGETARALADPRVRRAMLLALDRAGMVSRSYRGNGTVATQYVHPVVFGYDPALRAAPYDPAEARRLLAEAGFAGGFDVTLGHGFIGSTVVDRIVEDMGRIGIRVKSEASPFGEILQQARAGKVPLVYYAWACSTGDASDYFDSSLHSADSVRGYGAENFAGYSDRRTDELIEAADRELDPAKRLVLLQGVQRRVLEELPVLPLTIRWGFRGVSSRVDIVIRHDDRERIASFRWRN